jgi:hypothetical protein
MLYLLGKLMMFKNWLIAGGVFIAGLAAAVLFAKSKQKATDNAAVKDAVNAELEKISTVSKGNTDEVSKLPDAGPDSAADRMRDDWSER